MTLKDLDEEGHSNDTSCDSTLKSDQELWIFGYGSLVWRPGFEFLDTRVGYIKGFSRKFWQGNDVHRGSPSSIARVVTLVEEEGASTWGRAFRVKNEDVARMYLDHRESVLGGYTTLTMEFYSKCGQEKISVLVYVALPCNSLFLGPASLEQIAQQIIKSEGVCGHNLEYLAKLSAFMQLHVHSHAQDDHLSELTCMTRRLVSKHHPELMCHFDNAMPEVPIYTQDKDVFGVKKTMTKDTLSTTPESGIVALCADNLSRTILLQSFKS